MYEEGRGKSLVLDLLYLLNVGSDAGELIGLVFAPQVGSRAAHEMLVFGWSARLWNTWRATHARLTFLTHPSQHDAMPIICDVPPLAPSEPYLVAYSCMPHVLTPIAQARGCYSSGRVVVGSARVCARHLEVFLAVRETRRFIM